MKYEVVWLDADSGVIRTDQYTADHLRGLLDKLIGEPNIPEGAVSLSIDVLED